MNKQEYTEYNLQIAAYGIKNLYIHIPFCRKRCVYCDFYSEVKNNREILSDYTNAIIEEFEIYRGYLSNKIDTIYIGGGTPSILPIDLLRRLLEYIRKNIEFESEYEFTFEMNPESTSDEILQSLKEYAVNRISLGVQSLNDTMLIKFGRIHNTNEVFKSLSKIFAAGFENVNVDLLVGAIEDSKGIIENIIRLTSEFPIVHLSPYILTIKERGEDLIKLSHLLCDEMTTVSQYKMIDGKLRDKGFLHYEISNFSISNFQSRHNLNYWDCGCYIGLGASAAGHYIDQYGERIRYRNISNVSDYIKSVMQSDRRYDEFEKIDRLTHISEIIMLGLRKKEGVDIRRIKDLLDIREYEILQKKAINLRQEGLLRLKKDNISPTLKGFIFNNMIARELIF